jgi:hypothetical protein
MAVGLLVDSLRSSLEELDPMVQARGDGLGSVSTCRSCRSCSAGGGGGDCCVIPGVKLCASL